jgi:hypothetical protein
MAILQDKKSLKLNRQLYAQILCQGTFTHTYYTVLTIYKFFFNNTQQLPKVKSTNLVAFNLNKKAHKRHYLLTHLLFTWFNKQLTNESWQGGSQQWQGLFTNAALGFYLLRYRYLSTLGIYPFVPTAQWREVNPSQIFLLPWTKLSNLTTDLPLFLEDYLELEFEEFYRLGFQIRTHLPTGLPRWYGKTYLLRTHHFPVLYNYTTLPMVELFSKVPLKNNFFFDDLATARYSIMTAYKKQLLAVFKTFIKLGRRPQLITEYPILYRLKQQLYLKAGVSEAADFFQSKWEYYLLNRNYLDQLATAAKKKAQQQRFY